MYNKNKLFTFQLNQVCASLHYVNNKNENSNDSSNTEKKL